jgi:hypothetical protein
MTKLNKILDFLENNKSWNKYLQGEFYEHSVRADQTPFEKIYGLMFDTVNSQSMPKIENLAEFWTSLDRSGASTAWSKGEPPTLLQLVELLEKLETPRRRLDDGATPSHPWERLYKTLAAQSGWGSKTSALFVKNVINIHLYHRNLGFLSDFSEKKPRISDGDRIFLPVDSVMMHIFSNYINKEQNSFNAINNSLPLSMGGEFSNKQILRLDDLWFWGFITQRNENKTRSTIWNEPKYLALKFSKKDQVSTDKVKGLAKEFIKILGKAY